MTLVKVIDSKPKFINNILSVGHNKYNVRDRLQQFYRDAYGSNLNVTIDEYFANGTLRNESEINSTNLNLTAKKVINLRCIKFIDQDVSIDQMLNPQGYSWVSFNKSVVKSSKPLSGTYTIKCPTEGYSNPDESDVIQWHHWANSI